MAAAVQVSQSAETAVTLFSPARLRILVQPAEPDTAGGGSVFVKWGPGMEGSQRIEIWEPNQHLRVAQDRGEGIPPSMVASMITITWLLGRPAAEAEALQDRWAGILDRLFGQAAAV